MQINVNQSAIFAGIEVFIKLFLLKYDTLAHVAALKLYHNRSIEIGDRGQLCNYTYTTHSFTTACVTQVDQVIKQMVVLMGIINVESGGLIGDTFR